MKFRSIAAAVAMASALMLGGQASAAPFDPLLSSNDGRPWWDPTRVIEVPVDPNHAEGRVDSVVFTDLAGSHTVTMNQGARTEAVVRSETSGFTPGLYYTVRITLREADTGIDWGVYTWQTYRATADGKLHVNLKMLIPTRAESGERVVAVPVVYSADQVGQDGRPKKQDSRCVLNCKRVPPLAAWAQYSDPNAIITIQ